MTIAILASSTLCMAGLYLARLARSSNTAFFTNNRWAPLGILVTAVIAAWIILGYSVSWQQAPFIIVGLLSVIGMSWVLLQGTITAGSITYGNAKKSNQYQN